MFLCGRFGKSYITSGNSSLFPVSKTEWHTRERSGTPRGWETLHVKVCLGELLSATTCGVFLVRVLMRWSVSEEGFCGVKWDWVLEEKLVDHLATWWRCSGSSWRSGPWQWQMSVACRHASSQSGTRPSLPDAARSHRLVRPVFLWTSPQRLSAAGLLMWRPLPHNMDRHLEFVFIRILSLALRRRNGVQDIDIFNSVLVFVSLP
jgi:hypothetical protein